MGGLVGNPARLLGIIGLRLELHLQLRGDNQPKVNITKPLFSSSLTHRGLYYKSFTDS